MLNVVEYLCIYIYTSFVFIFYTMKSYTYTYTYINFILFYICICYSCLKYLLKYSILFTFPFSKQVDYVHNMSWKSFLSILDTSPISDINFLNVFSYRLQFAFFTWLCVFPKQLIFKIINILPLRLMLFVS